MQLAVRGRFEPATHGEASINSSGFLGGAQIGYNFQLANGVVIGAEADYAFANVEGKLTAPAPRSASAARAAGCRAASP